MWPRGAQPSVFAATRRLVHRPVSWASSKVIDGAGNLVVTVLDELPAGRSMEALPLLSVVAADSGTKRPATSCANRRIAGARNQNAASRATFLGIFPTFDGAILVHCPRPNAS
jgi:hypothetical protein